MLLAETLAVHLLRAALIRFVTRNQGMDLVFQ